MMREVTVDDSAPNLWHGAYSPRKIRYLLAHWSCVESLAERCNGTGGQADALGREWVLLCEDTRPLDCLCPDLNARPASPRSPGGNSSYGPLTHTASDIRADLEGAATVLSLRLDALVVLAELCAVRWGATSTEQEANRRQLHLSAERMARVLGWRRNHVE
jgi:hypothetical protein